MKTVFSAFVIVMVCAIIGACAKTDSTPKTTTAVRYDRWGWVKLSQSDEKLFLIVAQDSEHSGKLKCTVVNEHVPIRPLGETVRLRCLDPIIATWTMVRDPEDQFSYIGPDDMKGITGIDFAVFEIDQLQLSPNSSHRVRFGYQSNPYVKLDNEVSTKAFVGDYSQHEHPTAISGQDVLDLMNRKQWPKTHSR